MHALLTEDKVDIEDLPGVLRQMADLIGLQATLTIVKHYGGVRLYVPRNMTPEHILAKMIGFPAACKLSKEYGGVDHFDIPRAVAAIRNARDADIARKLSMGKSARDLAIEYQMTERGINKVSERLGGVKNDKQAHLF